MPQLSYVHGASDTPFIGDTIGVHFDRIAERFAERDALIVRHQQIRWTYRELRERVDAFAAGLLALALKRGDRIGVWSPNNAEWVITQFATARIGAILITINPAYRAAEAESLPVIHVVPERAAPEAVVAAVAGIGRIAGPPWPADQRRAAAAAWAALS